MPTPQAIPPKPDQLEISVFGPGFGESVVAHVGNGEWIVVDSCLNTPNGDPKPLEYLRLLDFDPALCVKVVVATHWHDDHVAGLSKTLDVCSSALFCCPCALSGSDFLKLAELYQEASVDFPPGPEEIRKSIDIAAHRSKKLRLKMLSFAKADSLVWASPSARLIALSPSDEMCRKTLEFMAQAYAVASSGKNIFDRLTPSTPNDTATALRLDVAGRSVLLGSDLEKGSNPLLGWRAVLTSIMGIEKKSSVFKVAHHGSKSGDHDSIWSDMLDPHPLALISPFRWGRYRLPDAIDRARILSKTDKAYITSHPNRDSPPVGKRSPKVETFIRQATNERRMACGPAGHVRWRASLSDLSDEGHVELFDGAIPLVEVA